MKMRILIFTLCLLASAAVMPLPAEQTSAERKQLQETTAKAKKGDALAQYNLGVMYANGQGVPKDEVEAVKWYRKASEQGDDLAQFNLGVKYANGQGVAKDEVEAYKWWLLAGAQGIEDAKEDYAIIERKLTPAQREEGQRMAREFKAQTVAKKNSPILR